MATNPDEKGILGYSKAKKGLGRNSWSNAKANALAKDPSRQRGHYMSKSLEKLRKLVKPVNEITPTSIPWGGGKMNKTVEPVNKKSKKSLPAQPPKTVEKETSRYRDIIIPKEEYRVEKSVNTGRRHQEYRVQKY